MEVQTVREVNGNLLGTWHTLGIAVCNHFAAVPVSALTAFEYYFPPQFLYLVTLSTLTLHPYFSSLSFLSNV